MVDLFLPYLYVPSAASPFVEIATPWGGIKVPLTLHQFYGAAVALAVVFLTILASYFRGSSKEQSAKPSKAKKSSPTKAKEKSSKKAKEPQVVGAKEAKSALEENILRNGANSYYYAHKVREISAESPAARVRQVISTYGWADGAKSVSIYVDHPEAGDLDTDKIQMEWTPTSLCLDITFDEDDVRSLVVPTLFGEISDVSYKLKKESIVFTLKKKELVKWKSLNGAAKNLEEHIEYDESLYD